MKTNSIQGKTFAFTGTLSSYDRATARRMVESRGGSVQFMIDSNLDYLVEGSYVGSRVNRSFELGIPVLTDSQFEEMLGIGDGPQK